MSGRSWHGCADCERSYGTPEPTPEGYTGAAVAHEPCSRCGDVVPVYARADEPTRLEAVCACEVGPDEDETCTECGAVLAGMFEGPMCRACDSGHDEEDDDEDACPGCARSFGPHYRGACTC